MRTFIVILLALLLGSCSRPQPIPQPSIFNPNLLGENGGREPTTVTADSVVFLGDSLTHIGWWRSYFPDISTANQGIGGNTTFDVLNRLQPILDARPRKIFLLIGANDYNFGVHPVIIAHNLDLIVGRIEEAGIDLYLQTIMPFGADVRQFFPQIPASYRHDIQQLNQVIATIGRLHQVTVLDTYAAMADADGNLPPTFTADRIHLEEPGYRRWVGFLRPHVEAE